jgi:hypothetical protein
MFNFSPTESTVSPKCCGSAPAGHRSRLQWRSLATIGLFVYKLLVGRIKSLAQQQHFLPLGPTHKIGYWPPTD